MSYRHKYLGRVQADASIAGRMALQPGAANAPGFKEVEERLTEAMRLWWRSPGGGKWPFAGDGPWHLVRADGSAQAEWDERVHQHFQGGAERPRPVPLSLAQIEERDRVSEWLRFVPDRDRRLVVLALTERASGRKNIRWSWIRRQLDETISPKGLDWRYSKAIHTIAVNVGMAENCASACQGELDNR